MEIWGSKSSGRRNKKRPGRSTSSRSRRQPRESGLMDNLWTGSLRTEVEAGPEKPLDGARRKRETNRTFNPVYIAILLFGIIIGAGIYALGSSVLRGLDLLGPKASQSAEAPEVVIPRPLSPNVISPPATTGDYVPPSGLTPLEVVQRMHQASLAGKAQVAYAYWHIQPDAVAFIGSGVQMSLSQCVDLARRHADQVRAAEFRLEELSGDTARVGQYLKGQKRLVYSLLKYQGRWQITVSTAT
jgi:hypothetical protein